MGLCFSKTEKSFGKSHYPYKDVTPLALLLWRYHLPWVRTVIRIVYENERIDPMMREYGSMLERTGATVDWVPSEQMDCVTASQLVAATRSRSRASPRNLGLRGDRRAGRTVPEGQGLASFLGFAPCIDTVLGDSKAMWQWPCSCLRAFVVVLASQQSAP